MCDPKGYGFLAVLVINRVSILAILAIASLPGPGSEALYLQKLEIEENYALKLWNLCVSFFMVNMTNGIARGRVLSPTKTTTAAAAVALC